MFCPVCKSRIKKNNKKRIGKKRPLKGHFWIHKNCPTSLSSKQMKEKGEK